MSDKSRIEWTQATWNPVTGCTRVSAGCSNCYVETWAKRFQGGDFSVQLHPEKLEIPLRWKRQRRIFVNSMSDLFHPDVPDDFIDRVFAVMALAPQHRFQVLTKRPERMRDHLRSKVRTANIVQLAFEMQRENGVYDAREFPEPEWPLPNVILGVSAEDQATADARIPILLDTPAAGRFVSIEPMLGPIDFEKIQMNDPPGVQVFSAFESDVSDEEDPFNGACIDWVIVGGESGPRARPIHPDWVRSIRDQCAEADVPFMFKQWGEWGVVSVYETHNSYMFCSDGTFRPWPGLANKPSDCSGVYMMQRLGKSKTGRLLDGEEHMEYPDMMILESEVVSTND